MIDYNNKEITKIKYNGKEIVKAYYNNHIVFDKSTPPVPSGYDLSDWWVEETDNYDIYTDQQIELQKRLTIEGNIKIKFTQYAIEKYNIANYALFIDDISYGRYKPATTDETIEELFYQKTVLYISILNVDFSLFAELFDENFLTISIGKLESERIFDETDPTKLTIKRKDSDGNVIYEMTIYGVDITKSNLVKTDIEIDFDEYTTDCSNSTYIAKRGTSINKSFNLKATSITYSFFNNYVKRAGNLFFAMSVRNSTINATPIADSTYNYEDTITGYSTNCYLAFGFLIASLKKDGNKKNITSVSYEYNVENEVYEVSGYCDGELAVTVHLTGLQAGYFN